MTWILERGGPPATLDHWLVRAGDRIRRDHPIARVSTLPMTFEVPSPVTGRVIALHVAPGERVEGGIPLATFDEVVPERK